MLLNHLAKINIFIHLIRDNIDFHSKPNYAQLVGLYLMI